MTIRNHKARRAYEWAKDHAHRESLPNRCARMADAAYEGMLACLSDMGGMRLDVTDAAENFVVDAFLFACQSNGVAWEGLADD